MPKQRPYGNVLPASSQQRHAPGGGGASPDGAKTPQIPYQRPRKGRISRMVLGIAFIVLVLSLLALGAIVFSYWQGQQSYKDVAQEAYPAAQDVFAQSEVDLGPPPRVSTGTPCVPSTPIRWRGFTCPARR